MRWLGRDLDICLGEWPEVGLEEARRRHEENPRLAREGRDPRLPTEMRFRNLWADWLKTRTPHWSGIHAFQVRRLGNLYNLPAFGPADPDKISPADVRNAFLPLFESKYSVAVKVLYDFSQAMWHGVAIGVCATDPSRDIRGTFPKDKHGVRLRAAVTEPTDIGRLVRLCRAYPGTTEVRHGLLHALWTGARPQEVVGVRWTEVDREQAVWTVPAARMKRRVEHAVPLPRQCMDMLRSMKEGAGETVKGMKDSDVFWSGGGNDGFRNGAGRDCAVYGKENWGKDTITKTAGTLAIVFKDLQAADVVQRLSGSTMAISKKADPKQSVTIAGWDEKRHSLVFGGTIKAVDAWSKEASPTAMQATAARKEVWKKAGLAAS